MPNNHGPQSARPDGSSVRIEPWDADGLALLQHMRARSAAWYFRRLSLTRMVQAFYNERCVCSKNLGN